MMCIGLCGAVGGVVQGGDNVQHVYSLLVNYICIVLKSLA